METEKDVYEKYAEAYKDMEFAKFTEYIMEPNRSEPRPGRVGRLSGLWKILS